MGCGSSKSEDASRSRNTPATPNTRPGPSASTSQVRSPAHQIGGKEEKKPEVVMPAPSYSDRKLAETEYFKDVIERATNKFIDVAEEPNQSNAGYGDQTKDYETAFAGISVDTNKVRALGLPHLSLHCDDPRSLLSDSNLISAADIDFMARWIDAVTKSVSLIQAREAGQLIAPFPEIA